MSGRYDKECEGVLRSTGAAGVLLVVLGGDRGVGMSVSWDISSVSPEAIAGLPSLLRTVADDIERTQREAAS